MKTLNSFKLDTKRDLATWKQMKLKVPIFSSNASESAAKTKSKPWKYSPSK